MALLAWLLGIGLLWGGLRVFLSDAEPTSPPTRRMHDGRIPR